MSRTEPYSIRHPGIVKANVETDEGSQEDWISNYVDGGAPLKRGTELVARIHIPETNTSVPETCPNTASQHINSECCETADAVITLSLCRAKQGTKV